MSGFFPIMMFGLPGAALAMYFAAPKERRPMVGGMLLSVAVTAFLTGVTEPLEFLFMFLAPLLYLLHALLTGISLFVATLLGIHAGFSFSAGAIDYALMYNLPVYRQPERLDAAGDGRYLLRYLLRGVQFGYPHVQPENAGS